MAAAGTSNTRDPRPDAVKAIAISFVLVWHLHPVYVDGAPALARAVAFFDFEVSLTAVPSFLVVSLWLFRARATDGAGALARRLWRLGQVFLFWVGVQTAVYAASAGRLPAPSWELIQLGGPALPRVGGSVFYYLFDLLLLTVGAALFARVPEPWRRRLGLLIAVGSVVWFEAAFLQGRQLLYYRIDSFLVYVPVAFYLEELVPHRRRFLMGWVLFAAQDLLAGRASDCVYGRVSILCGAVALVGYVWSSAASEPGRLGGGWLARTLSTWSLGLFALHKFWLYALLWAKGARSLNVAVGGATVHVAALLLFAGTLALTALSIVVLARSPLRRFVA